jgi:hypothetical protein
MPKAHVRINAVILSHKLSDIEYTWWEFSLWLGSSSWWYLFCACAAVVEWMPRWNVEDGGAGVELGFGNKQFERVPVWRKSPVAEQQSLQTAVRGAWGWRGVLEDVTKQRSAVKTRYTSLCMLENWNYSHELWSPINPVISRRPVYRYPKCGNMHRRPYILQKIIIARIVKL